MLTIAPDVAQSVPGARLVALAFDGAAVREQDDALWQAIQAEAERIAALYPNGDYSRNKTLQAVRRFYHRLGMDPTKWRPASEALVRRVTRGKGLYRINSAVDVINWCSLQSGLPYGLYDRAQVRGNVVFRFGKPGETYPGIRRDEQHAEGKPVLADELGAIGSPTADSARTMVTTATRALLVVIYGPAEVGDRLVQDAVRWARERLERWCGARAVGERWTRA